MATYYVDLEGGTPGASGTDYNNRVLSATSLNLAANDEIRYLGQESGSIGSGIWTSLETPDYLYGNQFRIGGGTLTSVTGCNTNTWTWTFPNAHGLAVGDYFIYFFQANNFLAGFYKVSAVVSSTVVQTTTTSPSTQTASASNQGACYYATNKIVRNNSGTPWAVPLIMCGGCWDTAWTAVGGTASAQSADNTSNNGLTHGPGGSSQLLTLNGSTGNVFYYNLPNAVSMNGYETLNWWSNPTSGYPRYWTQNGYNGFGSGQMSIRLYEQQNLSGNYIEYFFPYTANYNARWFANCANPYNPGGVNFNTFVVRSISLYNYGNYGSQAVYLTNFWLSEGRNIYSTAYTSNTNYTNGAANSVNIHSLIGTSAPGSSAVWWPVSGITEHGDVVIGNCDTFMPPATINSYPFSGSHRGFISPDTVASGKETITTTTYIHQTARRSPYYTGSERTISGIGARVNFRGGYSQASSMASQTGYTFCDSNNANGSSGTMFEINTNTALISGGIEKIGAHRWYQFITWNGGIYSQQININECQATGCVRAGYMNGVQLYGGADSTNPYVSNMLTDRPWTINFINFKAIANGAPNYATTTTLFLGNTAQGAPRLIAFSGPSNYILSNSSARDGNNSTFEVAYTEFKMLRIGGVNSKVTVKNNMGYGVNTYYCGKLDFDDLVTTHNRKSDLRLFGIENTRFNNLTAGYRSWNNSTGSGTVIGGNSSIFQDDPLFFGYATDVTMKSLTIDSRYYFQAAQVFGSQVGISTMNWTMSAIDYNFSNPAQANYHSAGNFSLLSTEFYRQNGSAGSFAIWKSPRGWVEKNTNPTFSYNNTGTSWKFTPGSTTFAENPSRFGIGKVAVDGQSPITIACKYYNLDTKNKLALVVQRNNCGILTDLTTGYVGVTTGSWQDLSLEVYPTQPGVLDVSIDYYNNNSPSLYVGQSFYIDSFSFT